MKWGSLERGHHYYEDDSSDREGEYIDSILKDHGVEYVLEHEFEPVREAVKEADSLDWIDRYKLWLDFLSLISKHDRNQLYDAFREAISLSETQQSQELVPTALLFKIATDVSRFLEPLAPKESLTGSALWGNYHRVNAATPAADLGAYASCCAIDTDLEWAKGLIEVTRVFRELLFLFSDTSDHFTTRIELKQALERLNAILLRTSQRRLVYSELQGGKLVFARENDSDLTPLESRVAEWISEYLVDHLPYVNLAVCVECGSIFRRARKDNSYCSKTCQNRFAYKRKKILESGAFRQIAVEPNAPDALCEGTWMYHSRFGLGVVEKVVYAERAVRIKTDNGSVGLRVPVDTAAEKFVQEQKALMKKEPQAWEEIIDPKSVNAKVRFMQRTCTFRFQDLFPGKGSDTSPQFYTVENPASLAEYLC